MSVVIDLMSRFGWKDGGVLAKFARAGKHCLLPVPGAAPAACAVANQRLSHNLAAMTPQDISKLIVRTSMKDRAAFDRLYRQTSAKLFGVCLRVLNDRGEAEEALQEVFVKIWTKADRFAVSELSPISWLVAIARNHAIDRIRARRQQPAADIDAALDIADPGPGPEAAVVAGDEAERVHRCLEELEQDRASAVRGAYLKGESYAELAERHGVPLNTMRTWLRRSLIKLRECLER
jgi:RNA polymerase sigma-70 factor (ECF subfamily)